MDDSTSDRLFVDVTDWVSNPYSSLKALPNRREMAEGLAIVRELLEDEAFGAKVQLGRHEWVKKELGTLAANTVPMLISDLANESVSDKQKYGNTIFLVVMGVLNRLPSQYTEEGVSTYVSQNLKRHASHGDVPLDKLMLVLVGLHVTLSINMCILASGDGDHGVAIRSHAESFQALVEAFASFKEYVQALP